MVLELTSEYHFEPEQTFIAYFGLCQLWHRQFSFRRIVFIWWKTYICETNMFSIWIEPIIQIETRMKRCWRIGRRAANIAQCRWRSMRCFCRNYERRMWSLFLDIYSRWNKKISEVSSGTFNTFDTATAQRMMRISLLLFITAYFGNGLTQRNSLLTLLCFVFEPLCLSSK